MGSISLLLALFIFFGLILAGIAFFAYRRVLRRAKGIERGLKMVPLLIHLPPPSSDSESNGVRDVREVVREKISQAQALYDLIAGTSQKGFKSSFYGQRHIAFEIIASNGLIHFFAAVPIALVGVIEQAILTAYPGARLEEVEDHNIFNPQGRLTGTCGGELTLRHQSAFPIATADQMEKDPMEGLLNALTKLKPGDGAAIQLMLRPAKSNWIKKSLRLVARKRKQRGGGLSFGAGDLLRAAVKAPSEQYKDDQQYQPSKLEESILQSIEEKTRHPGYEILIRVITASSTYDRSQMLLRNITTAFALYEAPGSNGFQLHEARDISGLVTAFIFRFFPPELTSNIINSVELAALFHLPDAQFTSTSQVQRQQSKQVDGPVNMPAGGLLMGYNFYRAVKKEIRLGSEDRRRHAYIVGQTGTGKSTLLENMAVQDMLAGNGFAFIDPHGDTAERLINMVPKERAEDVIYFNPADMEHPMGLNLFEHDSPQQKDFLIQESINMLYKLYDPQHTGIMGPRFEHWFRNAALTLMSDPNGASFIEIPKVFTDSNYLKNKFKYLSDPTVMDFWTKEMGQTSDYHKSEMLGWFVSKFGAFQSNDMMRNIIGQTSSAFDLRQIMDNKKILIVNLSKGLTGELNSKLLGIIFVIKIQAAAMSRSNVTEGERPDFCLYVDEFQNFSTDSFASILSEARKYRLNLIVANQFIGQLTEEIREAVFGNIGTIMSYRCGPEDAEYLVKQFEPAFDERDLVNLPNHNAVMRLLIGGLPSLPFSITALPPLGQPHAEMGMAVKQLSAAKFGLPRATVEADIFARLQNQPRPSTAAPKTELPPERVAKVATGVNSTPITPKDGLSLAQLRVANQSIPSLPATKPIQAPPVIADIAKSSSPPVTTKPKPEPVQVAKVEKNAQKTPEELLHELDVSVAQALGKPLDKITTSPKPAPTVAPSAPVRTTPVSPVLSQETPALLPAQPASKPPKPPQPAPKPAAPQIVEPLKTKAPYIQPAPPTPAAKKASFANDGRHHKQVKPVHNLEKPSFGAAKLADAVSAPKEPVPTQPLKTMIATHKTLRPARTADHAERHRLKTPTGPLVELAPGIMVDPMAEQQPAEPNEIESTSKQNLSRVEKKLKPVSPQIKAPAESPDLKPRPAPSDQIKGGEVSISPTGEVVTSPGQREVVVSPTGEVTSPKIPQAVKQNKPPKPKLKPGEVFVDENGEVVQG